jgi:hypothetical protein
MDQSEEVRVDLKMGAGELRVAGGAEKLMEGRFTYNRLRLRPEVSYTAGGFRGHLTVEEPNHVSSATSRYAWDLRLNNQKPLDLEVHCGAGQSRLDLGDLSLRRVSVDIGVGELKMDLRGSPKNDYSVYVRGGSARRQCIYLRALELRRMCKGGLEVSARRAWKSGRAGTSMIPMDMPRPRCGWTFGVESAPLIS